MTLKVDETKAEQRAKDKAIYMCAGYAAMIASGYEEERSISGCEADFKEAGVHLDYGKQAAVELMSRPRNVRAVERLAKELLRYRTLDSSHIEVIIDVADGRTAEEELEEFLRIRAAFTASK